MDLKSRRRAPSLLAELAETSLAVLFGLAFGLTLVLAGGCSSPAQASGVTTQQAEPVLVETADSGATATPVPTQTAAPAPRPSLPAPIPTLVLPAPSPEPSVSPAPGPEPTPSPEPSSAPAPTPTSTPAPTPTPSPTLAPSPLPIPSDTPAPGIEAAITLDGSSTPLVVRFDSDGVLIEALPTELRADAELSLDPETLPDLSGTTLAEECDSARALLDTDEALELIDSRIGSLRLTIAPLVGPALTSALKAKADELGLKSPALLVKNGLQIESISVSLESIDPDRSLLAALASEEAYRHELDARVRAKLLELRRDGTATIVADNLAAICDLAGGAESLSLEIQGSLARPDGTRERFSGSVLQQISLANPL